MTEHPVNGLDDVVHQRVRLGILTVAHEARRVEFGFLRTALDLTAGNLGQHLSVLEKAGLVSIEKGYEGKRPRTWVNLTPAGDKALREEIAHLKRLIRQVEQTTSGSLGSLDTRSALRRLGSKPGLASRAGTQCRRSVRRRRSPAVQPHKPPGTTAGFPGGR